MAGGTTLAYRNLMSGCLSAFAAFRTAGSTAVAAVSLSSLAIAGDTSKMRVGQK